MRSISVEVKVIVAVLAVAVASALAGARVSGAIFERNVEHAGLDALRDAAAAFAAHERAELEKLAATLDALLANEALREAFVARDRERLLAVTAPMLATMRERDGITHWYFHTPDPERKVFLRVHHPEVFGDRVERVTLDRAARTRELGAGKELGKTAFALRAVRPWIHGGELLGYVELAEDVHGFLAAMKARTGDEYGLLLKKEFLDEQAWAGVLGPRANTWNDRPDVVVVDTTTFTDGIIDFAGDLSAVPDDGLMLGAVTRNDQRWVRGIFPMRDASGRLVGGLFVLHDQTAQRVAVRAGYVESFFVLMAICGLAAALVILAVHRLVFVRLELLRREMEARAETAELPPGRVVQLRSDDELGRLEAMFHRIVFPIRDRPEAPRPDEPRARAGPGA
jgi:Double sensory domain of two-component sensor kinase